MHSKRSSFIVSSLIAITSLLFFAGCGTMRASKQAQKVEPQATTQPASFGVTEKAPPQTGLILDGTNSVTLNNVTPPPKRYFGADKGPQYETHLAQGKQIEYGVASVTEAMESIRNVNALAKHYGIPDDVRDDLIARLAPQLVVKGTNQPSATSALGQPQGVPAGQGWLPVNWGQSPGQDDLQRQIEALKAEIYGGKKKK